MAAGAASLGGPHEQQAATLGAAAAAEDASSSEPGSGAAAAASRHGSGRLELPPRRPEGVVDAKTGNYFGGRGGKPWVPPGAKVGPTAAAFHWFLRRRLLPLSSLPVVRLAFCHSGLSCCC